MTFSFHRGSVLSIPEAGSGLPASDVASLKEGSFDAKSIVSSGPGSVGDTGSSGCPQAVMRMVSAEIVMKRMGFMEFP